MFPVPDSEERTLLMQIAEGNEDAFSKLFYRYYQQLGAFIFRITESMPLAEEITQDVFMKIWMARESLVEVKSFKAYLFVVSKNYALNSLRTMAKERTNKMDWESASESLCALPANTEVNNHHYYSLIDTAINRLPPQQQKVYLMSRHKKFKYAEIADELQISKETVKKYIQLAVASITEFVRLHINEIVLLYLILSL